MADRADPLSPPYAPHPRASEEVRRRIAAVFYDRPDVARETASRMLLRKCTLGGHFLFTHQPRSRSRG